MWTWWVSRSRSAPVSRSAPNTLAFHRLGRNVGEVLGVFASADIRRRTLPTVSVRTSARRANLLKIEHLLGSLRSPQWPAYSARALRRPPMRRAQKI